MNLADNLINRLQAKSEIRQANSQIRQSRTIMNAPTQTAVNWPFLQYVQSQGAWAISSEGFQAFAGNARSEISIGLEDYFQLRPATVIQPNGVALIHVHGVLVDSAPAVYGKLGLVTEYKTISGDIADVIARGAKSIVLIFASPGGTVAGIKECAAVIASSKIPVSSYCASLTCSAAYYLAAGTKRITASPSAIVGNVGTILSWSDDTAFWEALGITFKALVSEGADLKSTFHLEPNETQLAFLQQTIDAMGADFRDHVAKHRPNVSPEIYRAGWYSGDKALALGLVDRIGTLDGAIPKGSATSAKASSAPAATLPKDDGLSISQAEYDSLPLGDKAEFKRLGGKIVITSGASQPAPANLTGFARVSAAFKK